LSVSSTRTPCAVVNRSPDWAQFGRSASSRTADPTAPSDERGPVAAAAAFFVLGAFFDTELDVFGVVIAPALPL
jgi:hypothetical protein